MRPNHSFGVSASAPRSKRRFLRNFEICPDAICASIRKRLFVAVLDGDQSASKGTSRDLFLTADEMQPTCEIEAVYEFGGHEYSKDTPDVPIHSPDRSLDLNAAVISLKLSADKRTLAVNAKGTIVLHR